MAKGSAGSFSAPSIPAPKAGIDTIMPFVTNLAMMNTIKQKQNMAAQSPSVQNPLQAAGILPDQQKNFKQVPKTVEVGGVPQTIPSAEEKKDIPDGLFEQITGGRATSQLLSDNVDRIIKDKTLRSQIGPFHASTHEGMIGFIGENARSMMKDPTLGSFEEFKSNTQDVFQNYRKFLEGVKGAVGGSGLISPILPQTTDPAEIYVGKAIGALGKMQKNDQILRDTLKGQNYKTGGIEGNYPVADVESIRNKAVQGGINVARNSDSSPSLRQPQQQAQTGGVDINKHMQMAKEAIQKGADGKKVAAMFKQETGQDYNG